MVRKYSVVNLKYINSFLQILNEIKSFHYCKGNGHEEMFRVKRKICSGSCFH